MRAGLLKHIICIYKPQIASNDYGEAVQTYIVVCKPRAQVISESGDRIITNDEVFFGYRKTFKVRSYVQVDESCQVEYNNKRYRILSIDDNTEKNEKSIRAEIINE